MTEMKNAPRRINVGGAMYGGIDSTRGGVFPASSLDNVLAAAAAHGLEVERRAGYYMMQCPVHTPDDTPSVSISHDPVEGRTLICCHHTQNPADTERILAAIGLEWADLYDSPDGSANRSRDVWPAKGIRLVETPARTAPAIPAGVYTLPDPYVPDDCRGELKPAYTRICETLGIQPRHGVCTAQCPVCGGALAVLYSPLEMATLFRCARCGGAAEYGERMARALGISVEMWRSNGFHVMAYDDPRGTRYDYEDGARVYRRAYRGTPGDQHKGIRSENAAGRHPLWQADALGVYAGERRPVFMTEGEKDAATLWAVGYAATTCLGGANGFMAHCDTGEARTALAGATVVAVVDKDDAGRAWANQVADVLGPIAGTLTFVQAAGDAHDATDAIISGEGFTMLADTDDGERPERVSQNVTPCTGVSADDGAAGRPSIGAGESAGTPADTAAADVDDMGGSDPDSGFWGSRPYLTAIRDAARSAITSPWAVLMATLTRVAAALPPNIVIPAIIGAKPSCHNIFTAIVGAPGTGKGLAEGVAAALVPDIRDATEMKPGSGEALAAMFAARRAVTGKDGAERHELICTNPRALLNVPEVQALGAVMNRRGSALAGELTSAWSGEQIGSRTKYEAASLTVPRYGYVLCLYTGVQPGNAGILFDQTATGLPQRFLWAEARDPYGLDPDKAASARGGAGIRPLIGDARIFPDDPADLSTFYRDGGIGHMPEWPLAMVAYPESVTAEIRRQQATVNRQGMVDGMDGHIQLLRLRVAMLLPWLDPEREDRMTVTGDDWQTAGAIVEHSNKVRRQCQAEQDDAAANDIAKRISRRRNGETIAAANMEEETTKTAETIMRYLNRRPDGRFTGIEISRGITHARRAHTREALAKLAAAGRITCAEQGTSVMTTEWRIAG